MTIDRISTNAKPTSDTKMIHNIILANSYTDYKLRANKFESHSRLNISSLKKLTLLLKALFFLHFGLWMLFGKVGLP